MGWSSASPLMTEIIKAVQKEVKVKHIRKRIYKPIISAFREEEADDLQECEGHDDAFDESLAEVYGND